MLINNLVNWFYSKVILILIFILSRIDYIKSFKILLFVSNKNQCFWSKVKEGVYMRYFSFNDYEDYTNKKRGGNIQKLEVKL